MAYDYKIGRSRSTARPVPLNTRRSLAIAGLRLADLVVRGEGKERAPLSKTEYSLFGKPIRNPVGLAAGVDKDAQFVDALSLFGFGFIEVGSVTLLPQKGSPKPNLFDMRDNDDEHFGLYNRMGCPSAGANKVVENLQRIQWRGGLVGVNISHLKTQNLEVVKSGYKAAMRLLAPFADYLVLNLSSPVAASELDVQDLHRLTPILDAVAKARYSISNSPPLLLKLANSNLGLAYVGNLLRSCEDYKIDGLIIGNTDKGWSGEDLKPRARVLIQEYGQMIRDAGLELIAAGGIDSAEEARHRLDHGASAVQILTAFTRGSAGFVRSVAREL